MTLFAFRARCIALIAAALAFAAPAKAAEYPARPIMLVVAFTPGGPSDVLARIVGKKMEQLLGQPVIIENRPGAGGNIAADTVAHAAPDGYTLLMGNNSILATNEALYKKITYNPQKDFMPITLIGTQANILVVNPDVPAKSLMELIALAKTQPGKINFASSGHGAAAHLAGELFRTTARVDVVHVPYKGAGPALNDMVSGQVQIGVLNIAGSLPHVQGGRLRPIAVTGAKRSPMTPDVPSIAEMVPGFDFTEWFSLVAPSGVPDDVIEKIYAAVAKAARTPGFTAKANEAGMELDLNTPAEFRALIATEIKKFAELVAKANIKLD